MHTDTGNEPNLNLVVVDREEAADGVVVLTLGDAADSELPTWQPGAHIDLVLGNALTRQYSLCGDPSDKWRYRIGVLRELNGRGGSAFIHDQLPTGASVAGRGPRNHFPLVVAARYLFIAGGIGITPLIPMVTAANAAHADWRLVYGGRSRPSMAFASRLDERYPGRVTIAPQDETGLLELDALLREPDSDLQVYCCGPEPLLAAVETRCSSWHRGSLHIERFAPRAPAERLSNTGFEVELAISGRTLFVPAERSILEVLQEAGVNVLSACSQGTCGTCETAVVEGAIDHRDSVLTPEERAAQNTMMICVSRAAGHRLVLRR